MARIFESIKENTGNWLDSLTDRERRLLGLFFSSIILILTISVIYLSISKINQKKNHLAKNKEQLIQVRELELDYIKAKKESERAKQRIRRNDVSLFSLIQTMTNKLGLSVKDLSETKRPIGKTEVVEISVKVNLTKLSIDRLTALLEAIEEAEEGMGLVKITKLKVNRRFDQPDLLDLQMTVATWKMA